MTTKNVFMTAQNPISKQAAARCQKACARRPRIIAGAGVL